MSSRNGLGSGSYTVTVTDNNGCAADVQHNITSPTSVSLSVSNQKNISCYQGTDGEVTLNATGGASQFEYSIDNGATWQPEKTFATLNATHFSFLTRDANHCTSTATALLTEPDALHISFTDILPAFCADPVGTATAVVTGGVETLLMVGVITNQKPLPHRN